MARASAAVLVLLGASAASAGCRVVGGGLPEAGAGEGDVVAAATADAFAAPDAPRDLAPGRERGPSHPPPPSDDLSGVTGMPEDLGCADGSREGFLELENWPDIAGCSGAWSVPGLLGGRARLPQCERAAGNSGANPGGLGCSVADLCAVGWHVCGSSSEVARQSLSGCESAVPPGQSRFFLAAAGASPQGICTPDPEAENDLVGCGSLGEPGTIGCEPLDRRMGFAECLATAGAWSCGGPDDHLAEAGFVVKTQSAFGGVLCCRGR